MSGRKLSLYALWWVNTAKLHTYSQVYYSSSHKSAPCQSCRVNTLLWFDILSYGLRAIAFVCQAAVCDVLCVQLLLSCVSFVVKLCEVLLSLRCFFALTCHESAKCLYELSQRRFRPTAQTKRTNYSHMCGSISVLILTSFGKQRDTAGELHQFSCAAVWSYETFYWCHTKVSKTHHASQFVSSPSSCPRLSLRPWSLEDEAIHLSIPEIQWKFVHHKFLHDAEEGGIFIEEFFDGRAQRPNSNCLF